MRQNVQNDNWSEAVAIVPPIANTYNATANDSDKTFTAPDNELWKVCHAHATLVSSADVGNRQMALEVSDADGNTIIHLLAGAVQAASLTRHYGFLQGIFRETAFVANELQVPLPIDLYVPPGGSIRIYDAAAIAAAADDMTVAFQYMKFTV